MEVGVLLFLKFVLERERSGPLESFREGTKWRLAFPL